MATRREKVEAGLFLLIGACLIFGAIFLLIGLSLTRETDSYYVHFKESIGNLKKNAPVRFKGVPIGEVGDITLFREMTQIKVELKIEKGTPITENVRAELKFNPLTQVYYVELSLDKKGGKLLKPGKEILSKPSSIDRIVNQIPEIQANLAVLIKQVSGFFSDENLALMRDILDHLEQISRSVPGSVDRLETEAVDLKKEIKTSLDRLTSRLEGSLGRIDEAAGRVEKAAREAENLAADNRRGIVALVKSLDRAAGESQALLGEARAFLGDLRKNPSSLVWPEGVKLREMIDALDETARETRILIRKIERDPSRIVWPAKVPERKTPDEDRF